MQFLHKYETVTAFTQDYNGTGYTEPWVSLTVEDDSVHYNKGVVVIDLHPLGESHYADFGLTYEITAEWRAKASRGELIENLTVMGEELVETSYGSGIIFLDTLRYAAEVRDGEDNIYVRTIEMHK